MYSSETQNRNISFTQVSDTRVWPVLDDLTQTGANYAFDLSTKTFDTTDLIPAAPGQGNCELHHLKSSFQRFCILFLPFFTTYIHTTSANESESILSLLHTSIQFAKVHAFLNATLPLNFSPAWHLCLRGRPRRRRSRLHRAQQG